MSKQLTCRCVFKHVYNLGLVRVIVRSYIGFRSATISMLEAKLTKYAVWNVT